ncbi:MAG: hypothetical protein RSB67_03970 [Clostridia bacterium]
MEDNLQRIFAILMSVLVFFMLPLYIAFEKKDDISYALALKITSNFVDNVTSKGYITKSMYDSYISDLAITDNVYDIKLEHLSKTYTPVARAHEKLLGDFNNDGEVNREDIKNLLNLIGITTDIQFPTSAQDTEGWKKLVDTMPTLILKNGMNIIKKLSNLTTLGEITQLLGDFNNDGKVNEEDIFDFINKIINVAKGEKAKTATFPYLIWKNDPNIQKEYPNATIEYNTSIVRYSNDQILGVCDKVLREPIKAYADMSKYEYKNLDIKNLNDSTMYSITNKEKVGVYTLKRGDEFNVIIQNKNTTTASVLFNALTLGANSKNNTKVYINYGGTVKGEEYKKIFKNNNI